MSKVIVIPLTEADLEVKDDSGQKRLWETDYSLIPGTDQIAYFRAKSKYGELCYGKFPDNHKGYRFAETGGGGPITIPYSFDQSGGLLVGLINELRINLGGERWCVIGGFLKPNEDNQEGQAREAIAEAGIDTTLARLLPGLPFVSNRNYFIADPFKGEGIHAHALEVSLDLLKPDGKSGTYTIREDIPSYIEKQGVIRFFPWKMVPQICCDGIARSGIFTLMADVM